MTKPPSSGVLRKADMIKITGLSKSTIDAKTSTLSPYFDPEFPQKFKLGNDRAVGWSRRAVEEWLEKRSSAPTQTALVDTPNRPPAKRIVKAKSSELTLAPTAKPKRQPAKKTLAEAVIQGSDLVANITQYTELATWTPAMGCLLAAGIAPEINVQEIPRTLNGQDLCDNELRPVDAKVTLARRLLNQWKEWAEDEQPVPTNLKPGEFMYWCWDNNLDTPWLQLIRQLGGSNDPENESISNAQLAILMRR